MASAVRVAAAGNTYAVVCVPFGWHQAPSLVQHLIGALLSELPDTQVAIVQYPDDIFFVGRDRPLTTQVACDTAAHLARKGFLVSPKSVLDATQSLMWMGKQFSLDRSRVAHKPEGLADIVGRWVVFGLSRYTSKPLQWRLGRIGWLACPGFSAGCFLAGARVASPGTPLCALCFVCRVQGPFGGNRSGESGVGTTTDRRSGDSCVHGCRRLSVRAWRVVCRRMEL